MFAFDQQKTLVLYIPKKNKVFVLLLTIHEVPIINKTTKKQYITKFYNSTKGGVNWRFE